MNDKQVTKCWETFIFTLCDIHNNKKLQHTIELLEVIFKHIHNCEIIVFIVSVTSLIFCFVFKLTRKM